MERSTTYGCHFIDQPLSSFLLRIDPPELPTHAMWWIQQTSSVGGRDFLPKLWGCFKFSSFTELVQRLMICWLLFRPFDIFEGRVGLFLCGSTACAITMLDMSIWKCLQGSHSVPNLSFPCLYYSILLFQLSGSSSQTIVNTF